MAAGSLLQYWLQLVGNPLAQYDAFLGVKMGGQPNTQTLYITCRDGGMHSLEHSNIQCFISSKLAAVFAVLFKAR